MRASLVSAFIVYYAMVCYQFTWYDIHYFEVNAFAPWNSMLTKFGNLTDADEDWQDISERLEHKNEVVI